MNHYPHHIGDFNNATRHLSRLERSIYRDLLDLYYDTEAPIPAETNWVCRRILATTKEEREAVDLVLSEFFDLDGDVYRNARCDAEIEAYRERRERAKANGRKGGRPVGEGKTQPVISGIPEGTQKKTNQNQNQNQNQGNTPKAPKGAKDALIEQAQAEFKDTFWPAYPRKDGSRLKALQSFVKARQIGTPLETIMAGLQRCKDSDQWQRDGGKFIPHGTTWINQRRWEDEFNQTTVGGRGRMTPITGLRPEGDDPIRGHDGSDLLEGSETGGGDDEAH